MKSEEKFEIRVSSVGLDLLEGEIMTSYIIKAANETDAKNLASQKFKKSFPSFEKVETYLLQKTNKQ